MGAAAESQTKAGYAQRRHDALTEAHGSAFWGRRKNGWWVQFDSAGGAAGRRDFEDPVLGPNPGSHFEPTALYPTDWNRTCLSHA